MRRLLSLSILLGILSAQGQEALRAPWSATLSLGQYPASLAIPRVDPLHPGLRLGATYHWSPIRPHHLTTSANLAYFYHANLQHGIQLYTELGYQFTWPGGLRLTPLLLGGGYQLSITDLPSIRFDPSTQRYEPTISLRQHVLILLGSTLGYQSRLHLWQRPVSFELAYRWQVQGPFINQNVPIIAYTPLLLGIALPLQR